MINPLDYIKELATGGVLMAGAGAAFWFLRAKVPGLLVAKFDAGVDALRASPWIRDQAHPHRLKLLVAVLVFLEGELPEPGQGKDFYDRLGTAVAARMPSLLRSPEKWSAALMAAGDAIDTQIDADLKAMTENPPATQG